MKLESLKSSRFEAMSSDTMSKIKGGEMVTTNYSRDAITKQPIPDRQNVIYSRDKRGNITGVLSEGCIEYCYNGVWK
ncbi:hypothetical protein [Chryseobacterium herbae]|uniref:Uncharacterized protein n=1 Tax=Chryseobacterium herbae TaxID=2976476 RepID=A0ABT2IXT3_9FLAO|nr:hypothetical protein [Chryseobacterium sp. pc1-10]MCT2563653.1 hypothetical protein [Chryseobacterium sp. pc1-10]